MKRRLLLFVAANLIVFGVSAVALSQVEKPPPQLSPPPLEGLQQVYPPALPSESPSIPPRVTPAAPATPKADLVEELIGILNKTESTDTFCVTLSLLQPMKTHAKMAIPAIMRNAERLGIFKNHLTAKSRDAEMVEGVIRVLQEIRSGEAEKTAPPVAACGLLQPSSSEAPPTSGKLVGAGLGALAGNLIGKSRR